MEEGHLSLIDTVQWLSWSWHQLPVTHSAPSDQHHTLLSLHHCSTSWVKHTCWSTLLTKMWHSCQLDSDDCLDLDQILKVFSAPITEEHAWALVHQVRESYYFRCTSGSWFREYPCKHHHSCLDCGDTGYYPWWWSGRVLQDWDSWGHHHQCGWFGSLQHFLSQQEQ